MYLMIGIATGEHVSSVDKAITLPMVDVIATTLTKDVSIVRWKQRAMITKGMVNGRRRYHGSGGSVEEIIRADE